MNILVTGGTGYIGSHTVVELLNNGHKVIIVDNLINSTQKVLDRVKEITQKEVKFYYFDITDEKKLDDLFTKEEIHCCIHFAALKAVEKSVYNPLEYYHNNIEGTLVLLKIMQKHNCKKIIYSSSATVYGNSKIQPITEKCPRGICTNPYGWTKVMLEQILSDLYNSDNQWHIIMLRYFNPIGAHKSGLIGENPNGVPSNLMPYITQVAVGRLPKLSIYGNDYDTKDGTCVRDYVHVLDLASGHVAALKKFDSIPGLYIYNLGTGKGYTVLDVVHTFEEASGIHIEIEMKSRRKGDVAVCFADPHKANEEIGWKAQYNLFDMCKDSWNWQKLNPKGY